MSAEVGPLVKQIARDLAMTWPTTPPVVDLVTEAPLAGTQAPVGVILATRGGGCLSKHRGEPQRVHDARIIASPAAGSRRFATDDEELRRISWDAILALPRVPAAPSRRG